MLYHPEENIVSKLIKIVAFGASLFVMIWLFLLVLFDDIKNDILSIELTLNKDMQIEQNLYSNGKIVKNN